MELTNVTNVNNLNETVVEWISHLTIETILLTRITIEITRMMRDITYHCVLIVVKNKNQDRDDKCYESKRLK